MTYGWMLILVAIVGGALITAFQDDSSRQMPEDFNLTESKQAVTQAVPGTCTNTRNESYDDYVYYFECTQEHGNYSYVGEARVVYNETGSDRVIVFD
jgi:hypothetical protein